VSEVTPQARVDQTERVRDWRDLVQVESGESAIRLLGVLEGEQNEVVGGGVVELFVVGSGAQRCDVGGRGLESVGHEMLRVVGGQAVGVGRRQAHSVGLEWGEAADFDFDRLRFVCVLAGARRLDY
jgi:hypothetical protein